MRRSTIGCGTAVDVRSPQARSERGTAAREADSPIAMGLHQVGHDTYLLSGAGLLPTPQPGTARSWAGRGRFIRSMA